MKQFKTYSQTQPEQNREWFIIDASTMPLGRLAVIVADKLMGKSKVTFTPHTDNGDFVVVTNAKKLVVTGEKMTDKHYYSHSGYIGNLRDLTLQEVIEKYPERAIEQAVAGMLPKNKLAPLRMKRLKVFPGEEHAHTAQQPKPIKETK